MTKYILACEYLGVPTQQNGAETHRRGDCPECRAPWVQRLRGHTEFIGDRFERNRAALLPLSVVPREASEKITARVSSILLSGIAAANGRQAYLWQLIGHAPAQTA